jgi:1-aminocyclopropane-1-carboxylate deaminase/D-cysteine desulfhydrase-like pyridoxal-dependent ACC family enzyme
MTTRPIFQRYPELNAHLPWQPLADLPTPVQQLPGTELGWIKRDDLTHAAYGGNKVRKLEFVVAEMQAKGIKRAYTFGATGTNAGVAAALMCQAAGILLTVFTFDQPDSPTVQRNQALMRAAGAKLVHCGTLLATVLTFYVHPARLRNDAYFLFAGCSNPVGVLGYVNAALELAEQIAAGELPEPAVIVVPVGSNGTLAGLTVGLQLAGLKTRLVGVRVAASHLGPIATCTTGAVQQMVDQTTAFLRQHVPSLAGLQVQAAPLNDAYYGEGYGVPTAAGNNAIGHFMREFSIPLEPTYTGKAAAAFLDELEVATGPVLFWDTFNSRSTDVLLHSLESRGV